MTTRSPLLTAALLLGMAAVLQAGKPSVTRLSPMAVAPGRMTTITVVGENLSGATGLWTSFPSHSSRSADGSAGDAGAEAKKASFDIEVPGTVAPGVGAIRVVSTSGVSSWHLLAIDSFATAAAGVTNDPTSGAPLLSVPGAVEGRAGELKTHFFRVSGRRGQRLFVDVVANRVGSAMDPLLRVSDAGGREIAFAEDTPGLGADVAADWKLPRSGEYRIEVRDTQHRGGESFRYRLRAGRQPISPGSFRGDAVPGLPGRRSLPIVGEVEPNNTGVQAQAIVPGSRIEGRFNKAGDRDVFELQAEKNQRLVFAGKTRGLGSACDLFLQLAGTNGSVIAEANVAGANPGTITNTFKAAGKFHLIVEELNHGGVGQPYRIDVETLPPGFALTVDQETLALEPGGKVDLPVTIERRQYDGPVTLELAGLPSGFMVTNNLIKEKAKESKVQIIAPVEIQPGDWFHFAVRGFGTNDGEGISASASTAPALRNLWPRMLYHPEALDGWIALGIRKPE